MAGTLRKNAAPQPESAGSAEKIKSKEISGIIPKTFYQSSIVKTSRIGRF